MRALPEISRHPPPLQTKQKFPHFMRLRGSFEYRYHDSAPTLIASVLSFMYTPGKN